MTQESSWVMKSATGLMVMLLTALLASAQDLTWEQTHLEYEPIERVISALLATPDGTLYAAGASNGEVYRSEDKGNTWTQVGSTDIFVKSLVVLDATLYAGTSTQGRKCLTLLFG